ncbi:OsmC family protein [Candidatus Bipolaricaulota bacterium]|nr:OsmC family protein [Candidatus Bipolaricaulota bacterium]
MSDLQEAVTVRLTNQKVRFTGVSNANPDMPITFDYRPPLGDGMGYNGLELLLMSLAGCSATAIVFVLRRMGKTVSGLEVNAKGIRRDRPPITFEKIFIDVILRSQDTTDADIQKAIQLAEQSVCPVWQMVKNNVDIVPQYTIMSSSGNEG